MYKDLIKELKGYISDFHIESAKNYNAKDIKLLNTDTKNNLKRYAFSVKRKDNIFEEDFAIVKIAMYDNLIRSVYCSCYNFGTINTCEHIPAVIMNYKEFTKKDVKSISKSILKEFYNSRTNVIKKKLHTEFQIEIHDSFNFNVYLKFKIGYDKMYTISASKMSKFIESFKSGNSLELGKNFTYDPKLYYFSVEDEEILNFIINNSTLMYDNIYLDNYTLTRLLDFLKDRDFIIKDVGIMHGIKEEVPFKISLNKKDNIYNLAINYSNIKPITESYEYIIYNNEAYHLTRGYQKLLNTLLENNIKSLEFNKEEIPLFNNGILPIIKNELQVAKDIKEISPFINPNARLYFDIFDECITCDLKFLYGEKEISYFNKNNELLRDIEYENKCLNDIINYGFIIDEEKILLFDLSIIVDFLEYGINELATKYDVYTSEKIRNTNIKKRINISSNFTIGEDNIMHYSFNMEDINDEEISNLIKNLRKNKKYHKLSNGDIISLEDENIKELNNLLDDLDIDVNETKGVIPKYQAIYLDYLKKEKYPSIKTNNLFTEFIDKFNTYKNGKLDFTEEEKNILRPYQIEGVEWLYNIYKCDLGGILADEMGLGKTIQTIYFFRKLKNTNKKCKFLVVCPTALVYNWLKEFEVYGKDLSVKVLTGPKEARKKILAKNDALCYITSYGTLREDILLYENITFTSCVIDEAQNIKNPYALLTKAVKNVKANTKIALTGTPLENSVLELWSIFDFIMPGYLSNIRKFNEKYSFKEQEKEAKEKINKLKALTSPFILRRKKKDVVKELPEKYENIIYIDLDKEQKKVYALEVKKVKDEINNILIGSTFREKQFQILSLLTRLRQICVDPRLVYENYRGGSSKIETLVKTVLENIANNHKILIFTTFKSVLDIIKKEFTKNKITYYIIDGSVSGKNRQILVDKFNSDATNTFLITLKSGGTGLNLTSADVVIHLDLWWNPQVENQATDRAHRIGQINSVEVIKLIASGTIEERILELQQKKKVLADELIEKGTSGNIALSSLKEEDIKRLIDFDSN